MLELSMYKVSKHNHCP